MTDTHLSRVVTTPVTLAQITGELESLVVDEYYRGVRLTVTDVTGGEHEIHIRESDYLSRLTIRADVSSIESAVVAMQHFGFVEQSIRKLEDQG